MRISLATRLKKLELARRKQGPNRIVVYDATQPDGARNALRSVGRPGRYLLIPNYGSMAEWEAGLRSQQQRLMNEAERRN